MSQNDSGRTIREGDRVGGPSTGGAGGGSWHPQRAEIRTHDTSEDGRKATFLNNALAASMRISENITAQGERLRIMQDSSKIEANRSWSEQEVGRKCAKGEVIEGYDASLYGNREEIQQITRTDLAYGLRSVNLSDTELNKVEDLRKLSPERPRHAQNMLNSDDFVGKWVETARIAHNNNNESFTSYMRVVIAFTKERRLEDTLGN